ncbi:hypothetical protein [Novosphingobium sp.]|uniref:hypothetical protein n=1 Tax=Novosphingobium sp. TaxID=1874826 RepID=UPI0033409828
MPLRQYRFFPDTDPADDGDAGGPPRVLPRLAGDHDDFVASPVHELQENLWAFTDTVPEADLQLYPGWVRLAVPVVSSAALWALIFWVVSLVRHG